MVQADTNEIKRKSLLQEKRLLAALNKGKVKSRESFEKLKNNIRKLKRNLPPNIGIVESLLIFSIAAGSDVLDYLIIGSIPIIGDILDIVTWMIIAAWVFSDT